MATRRQNSEHLATRLERDAESVLPVFALFDQQRVAVGIHTAATGRSNRATRINRDVYDFLSRFTNL